MRRSVNFLWLLLLALTVCGVFPAMPASADEIRPALLDIKEQKTGLYAVTWKVPMRGNRALAMETARELEARIDEEMMRAPGMGALQHYLATPLRVMVRFGMWDEILAEPAPPEYMPITTAVWHAHRAIADAIGVAVVSGAARRQLRQRRLAPVSPAQRGNHVRRVLHRHRPGKLRGVGARAPGVRCPDRRPGIQEHAEEKSNEDDTYR